MGSKDTSSFTQAREDPRGNHDTVPCRHSSRVRAALYKVGGIGAVLLLLVRLYVFADSACTMHKRRLQIDSHLDNGNDNINIAAAVQQQSVFLPFVNRFGTHGTPLVKATVAGVPLDLPVDTGSTGLLIGAPLLPDVPPNAGTPVHHYFTSSNILYKARLVSLPITFHGLRSSHATARVPVLVVDESFVCPWYDPSNSTGECQARNGEEPKRRDVSGIMYMGVGFGRNAVRDGMPAAIPAHNPFLNIESINSIPIAVTPSSSSSSSSFHTGYTLSNSGIQLGLTPQNTLDFAWTRLKPGLAYAQDPRDWSMLEMSFVVNHGREEHRGAALIDTGIPHMYLRTSRGHAIPNITIPNPNPNGYAKCVRRVKNGTLVEIRFPLASSDEDDDRDVAYFYLGENKGDGEEKDNATVAEYMFQVGDGSAHAPAYVVPNHERGRAGPYVNTGRNFLWAFDVAFDAVKGRFGFRAVGIRHGDEMEKEREREKEKERFDARL